MKQIATFSAGREIRRALDGACYLAAEPRLGPERGILMTSLVFLLLVVLWGAVFGPAIFRAKQETSPISTIGSFRRGMRALSRNRSASGRWVLAPKTPADFVALRRRTILRRRRLFTALLATSGVTLVGGLLPDLHALLIIHIAVDLSLAGFVLFLLQLKPGAKPRHGVRRPVHDEPTEPEEHQLEAVGEARRLA